MAYLRRTKDKKGYVYTDYRRTINVAENKNPVNKKKWRLTDSKTGEFITDVKSLESIVIYCENCLDNNQRAE